MLTVIAIITLVAEPTITTGKGLDITYLSSIIRLPYNRASEEAFSIRARHGHLLIFKGYQQLLSDGPETEGTLRA